MNIPGTGTKIAFMSEVQLTEEVRKFLIEIDSHDDIRCFHRVGDDKTLIHLIHSKKEQLKIMIDYLLLGSETFKTFFFRLGRANGFSMEYQIGSGKLYHFQQLPESVKVSWQFWKKNMELLKTQLKTSKMQEIDTKHMSDNFSETEEYSDIIPV